MTTGMRRSAVFLILLFLYFSPNACYPQEALKKEERVWDLGRVKRNAVIKRAFSFKNDSGRAMNITGMNTSCSCTVTAAKDKSLLPGQSTEVEVKFNSRGYSPGAVQQHVYINTDDPNRPVLKFTVKAEVTE